VTEVPAIFGAVCDQVVEPWPSYHGGPAPAGYRELARAIFEQHRHEFGVGDEAVFDGERSVIQGSYAGGGSDALKKTFEQAPPYRKAACNEYCRAQLDYGRGDDFLQIGKMDISVITNWLTRRIPTAFQPELARQMKLWRYPAAAPVADGTP
jgi:hypothetical protein